MKKHLLSMLLVLALLMNVVACTDDPSTTGTTTTEPDAGITTTEPADDGTTTAEPDDGDDGTTTTAEPDDGTTTTAEPDDGTTTTAAPDDGDDGTTTTAEPDDGTTTTAAPDDGNDDPDAGATTTAAPDTNSTTGDPGQIENPEEDDFIPTVRVVFCSDIHLQNTSVSDDTARFAKLFQSAYRFAEQDEDYKALDAVIVVGDMVDSNTVTQYNIAKTIVNANLREGTQLVTVMGNHEFYNAGPDTYKQEWDSEIDKHIVINGFHFIGLSPCPEISRVAYSDEQIKWMEEQLAVAAADDPNKPIFTFQHLHIKNTVYDSDIEYTPSWEGLDNAYVKYPQVINFSGDSHGPINNPKSVRQAGYTQFGTGSLYTTWTSNLFNVDGTRTPAGFEDQAQYYIVEVDANNRVRVYVYDIFTDDLFKTTWNEQDPDGDMIYEINTPADKSSFTYTDARGETKPYFGNTAAITVTEKAQDSFSITIPQAFFAHGPVYGYRIAVECTSNTELDGYELMRSSRYYDEPMPATLTWGISELKAGETYKVSVYPISAWGVEGDPITVEVTTSADAKIPYTSQNRVNFEGTFSNFDTHTELLASANPVYGGQITGDIFYGGWKDGSKWGNPGRVTLKPGKGYNGSAALAITNGINDDKAAYYFATEQNGNQTTFYGAEYLRMWVDFTRATFTSGSFGVVTRSGELFTTKDAPADAALPFYCLADGTTEWVQKAHQSNGCFGQDMSGFKGWIAIPFSSMYSRLSTPHRALDTDSAVGIYFTWNYYDANMVYIDEIQFVEDYTVFTAYTGSYENDVVEHPQDPATVPPTYTETDYGMTVNLESVYGCLYRPTGKDYVLTLDGDHSFFWLGDIDLSKYTAVKVYYGGDSSVESEGKFIGLINSDVVFRKTGAEAHNVLTYATMVDIEGRDKTAQYSVIDLTDVTYSGDVYLTDFRPYGSTVQIYAVEFYYEYDSEELDRFAPPISDVIDLHSLELPEGWTWNSSNKFLKVARSTNHSISLGTLDLSKYTSVKIGVGVGATSGDYPNLQNGIVGLTSAQATYGNINTPTVPDSSLAHSPIGIIEGSWTEYILELDLSDVNYTGEVFLTGFGTSLSLSFTSIEFIG